ncbi:MAG: anti-sigma factor family protein [Blastocatellia bacterium]
MGDFFYNSELLTCYLLGELPAAEQDRLEEEYFCNNEVFTALLNAKDQLISDYLDGKLTDADRQRFERHFLTLSGRRREVELASFLRPGPKPQVKIARLIIERWALLRQAVSRVVQSPQFKPGLVTAVLVIGSVVGWQMMHRSPERNSGVTIQPSDISEGQTLVSLSLKPIVRSLLKQDTTAEIGKATQTIDLNFDAGKERFQAYQGNLRNQLNQSEVLSDSSLKAVKNQDGIFFVNWKVPASKLPVGDYAVTLTGIAQDGSRSRIGSECAFEVRYLQAENPQPSK